MNRFCKGGSETFDEMCPHSIPLTEECRLLKDKPMKVIFEQGSCAPYEIVRSVVKGILRRYDDLIQPEEYIDAMTFEISERIQRNYLTAGQTIRYLKAYINRTVYCEVHRMLEEEGYLSRGKCGYCVYLSRSKQYTCKRQTVSIGEQRMKVENPYYGMKRERSEPACAEGFEMRDNPQRICGNCIHLPRSKEYVCERKTLIASFQLTVSCFQALQHEGIPDALLESLKTLKNRKFCTKKEFLKTIQDYAGADQIASYKGLMWKRLTMLEGDEIRNPHYGEKRIPSESSCEEGGFAPYALESLEHEPLNHEYKRTSVEDLVDQAIYILQERVQNEQGDKRKQICKRQYTIFCYLRHLLEQGFMVKEAKKEIQNTLGMNSKMFERDLQEIREYLERKNVEFS
jgi:hypothetical protein